MGGLLDGGLIVATELLIDTVFQKTTQTHQEVHHLSQEFRWKNQKQKGRLMCSLEPQPQRCSSSVQSLASFSDFTLLPYLVIHIVSKDDSFEHLRSPERKLSQSPDCLNDLGTDIHIYIYISMHIYGEDGFKQLAFTSMEVAEFKNLWPAGMLEI